MFLRELAKKLILTGNTSRYLIETPRLEEALRLVGSVDTLLDAGAGGGHYATHCYLPMCRRLVAIEYDAHNFKILQQSLAPFKDRAEAIRGSATQLPVPDTSVDCVTCTQVMEHIVEDNVVVDEFQRVLKPQGYALITVPLPPAPWPESDHVREGYRFEELDALFVPRASSASIRIGSLLWTVSVSGCGPNGGVGAASSTFSGFPRPPKRRNNAARRALTPSWRFTVNIDTPAVRKMIERPFRRWKATSERRWSKLGAAACPR